MHKVDLSRAFRQLIVDPSDFLYLCHNGGVNTSVIRQSCLATEWEELGVLVIPTQSDTYTPKMATI